MPVVITLPIADRRRSGYTAVFADPDGHLWMIEAGSVTEPAASTSRP